MQTKDGDEGHKGCYKNWIILHLGWEAGIAGGRKHTLLNWFRKILQCIVWYTCETSVCHCQM